VAAVVKVAAEKLVVLAVLVAMLIGLRTSSSSSRGHGGPGSGAAVVMPLLIAVNKENVGETAIERRLRINCISIPKIGVAAHRRRNCGGSLPLDGNRKSGTLHQEHKHVNSS
jgi:hypothetical protein